MIEVEKTWKEMPSVTILLEGWETNGVLEIDDSIPEIVWLQRARFLSQLPSDFKPQIIDFPPPRPPSTDSFWPTFKIYSFIPFIFKGNYRITHIENVSEIWQALPVHHERYVNPHLTGEGFSFWMTVFDAQSLMYDHDDHLEITLHPFSQETNNFRLNLKRLKHFQQVTVPPASKNSFGTPFTTFSSFVIFYEELLINEICIHECVPEKHASICLDIGTAMLKYGNGGGSFSIHIFYSGHLFFYAVDRFGPKNFNFLIFCLLIRERSLWLAG